MPSSFASWSAEFRPRVEAELDELLPAVEESPRRLHEALRHAVFAGGKRVRPLLTVLAGAETRTALRAGACVELIHTYSLVHDDLPALDDDDLRRGRPTVHRAYDEATAILTGDSLLTLGLSTLAALPLESAGAARAVALVGEAIGTRGMIGGQMEDLEAEKNWPSEPEAALERIHRLKTGALLVASVRLGGLCQGVSEAEDTRLRELGERVGLLFQIGDDILDVEGTSESLGKTAGKDAASEKLTYPGLYGLDESRRLRSAVHAEALDRAATLPQAEIWRDFLDFLVERSS